MGRGILPSRHWCLCAPSLPSHSSARWHKLWFHRSRMRLSRCACALVAFAISAAACNEEGTIKVHKLTFKGVKAVDRARLKAALATHESSWLPWGKKAYFDRSRFDADRSRILAFYSDRGYPDARVTGFDVKLNDKQDQVDLTVTVTE